MLYSEFMYKAKKEVIETDEASGITYLIPCYRQMLRDAELTIDKITDFKVEFSEVEDELKLEVTMRNAKMNKMNIIVDWIAEIITSSIDPAMMQEESDLIKNTVDYMQTSIKVKEKEKELAEKETLLEKKEDVTKIVPFGMNFSKKKP